jgi:putative transposase
MERSEMQRLKALEDENRRLKQIVAEQTLDIQALKAVLRRGGHAKPR